MELMLQIAGGIVVGVITLAILAWLQDEYYRRKKLRKERHEEQVWQGHIKPRS